MKKPFSKRFKQKELRVIVPARPIDRAIMDFQILGKSEGLIKLFQPFLKQYVKLLYYKNLDYSNRQLRYFISYFISDKELRRQIRSNMYVSYQCKEEAKRIMSFLHRNFLYEYEDEAFHDLILVLLKMAKDYEESGSGFKGFVHTYYSRYLKSYLLTEDARRLRTEPLIFAKNYSFFEDEQDVFILSSIFEDEYFSTEDEDENMKWYRLVSGNDESVFSCLTTIQRRILIGYYIDQKTDNEIGKELAMHPGSVQRSRRKIYKKLWDQLKKGELKCSRLNQELISLDSLLNQKSNALLFDAEMKNLLSEEVICK